MLLYTTHIWLWCIQMLLFALSLFFKQTQKTQRNNLWRIRYIRKRRRNHSLNSKKERRKNIIGLLINKLLQNKVSALAFKIMPVKSLRWKSREKHLGGNRNMFECYAHIDTSFTSLWMHSTVLKLAIPLKTINFEGFLTKLRLQFF